MNEEQKQQVLLRDLVLSKKRSSRSAPDASRRLAKALKKATQQLRYAYSELGARKQKQIKSQDQ